MEKVLVVRVNQKREDVLTEITGLDSYLRDGWKVKQISTSPAGGSGSRSVWLAIVLETK